MHEQEVVTLNRGLTVFRPAMTLNVVRDGRTFTLADYRPLREHYDEKTAQIHVVAEYAKLGMADIRLALRLAMDYFELDNKAFVATWFKGKERTLRRETLPDHYDEIVTRLANPAQERIVADDRERTNVLVLAGPGSGKTRVLVHRIAYLIRVRRENPRRILALTFNRQAAVQARRRLHDLIGDDARGVNVMTCHALAMRILGISFADTATNPTDDMFEDILRQAALALGSDGETPAAVTREADDRAPDMDPRRRVPGHRRTRVRTHLGLGRANARGGRRAAQPVRRGRRRPERLRLEGRLRRVHPPLRPALSSKTGLSGRELPLDTKHHRRREPLHRRRAGAYETRAAFAHRRQAPARPRRRALGRARWPGGAGRSRFFALRAASSRRRSPR